MGKSFLLAQIKRCSGTVKFAGLRKERIGEFILNFPLMCTCENK